VAEPEGKPKPKPIVWMGSSRKDLKAFPDEPRHAVGYALFLAQLGDQHPNAKMLKGFGGGSVLEVVEDFDGNTYRGIYTVRFKGWLYVLHAFQKKSKRGRKTPREDLAAIPAAPDRRRTGLREAKGHQAMKKISAVRGSGNVFKDLGMKNPEEALTKARLAALVARAIKRRKLTQQTAAGILGIDQPRVSKLLRGHLSDYSIERLMLFLVRMGLDVEISIQEQSRPRRRGHLNVVAA
jgi:phage-related protein/predicted XRE-type DNA-binding protein